MTVGAQVRHAVVLFLLVIAAPGATAQTPSSATIYKEALAADERGETERAIALYRQVLRLEPGSVPARTNLGRIR
jgi:Flp pilus assembly protein TadD